MQSTHPFTQQQTQSQALIEQRSLIDRIRKQSLIRTTTYIHPQTNIFSHQPINNKQSQQLRKQLISLYKPKVQQVRRTYDPQEVLKTYEQVYDEFIRMTLSNQQQERKLTQNIQNMHEMADILMHPPQFSSDRVFLSTNMEPDEFQQQEINNIFDKYQQAYKAGQNIQENQAQETIKRAKQFLLDRYA